MTQGFFIVDEAAGKWRRPKSKKELREAIADLPQGVEVEATSWHGDEYGGILSEAPNGTIVFCGPDPHSDRRFYGTVVVKDGTFKVK